MRYPELAFVEVNYPPSPTNEAIAQVITYVRFAVTALALGGGWFANYMGLDVAQLPEVRLPFVDPRHDFTARPSLGPAQRSVCR